MLDIKQIREDPDAFRAGLARRNLGEVVDELLAADERRRTLTAARRGAAGRTEPRLQGDRASRPGTRSSG